MCRSVWIAEAVACPRSRLVSALRRSWSEGDLCLGYCRASHQRCHQEPIHHIAHSHFYWHTLVAGGGPWTKYQHSFCLKSSRPLVFSQHHAPTNSCSRGVRTCFNEEILERLPKDEKGKESDYDVAGSFFEAPVTNHFVIADWWGDLAGIFFAFWVRVGFSGLCFGLFEAFSAFALVWWPRLALTSAACVVFRVLLGGLLCFGGTAAVAISAPAQTRPYCAVMANVSSWSHRMTSPFFLPRFTGARAAVSIGPLLISCSGACPTVFTFFAGGRALGASAAAAVALRFSGSGRERWHQLGLIAVRSLRHHVAPVQRCSEVGVHTSASTRLQSVPSQSFVKKAPWGPLQASMDSVRRRRRCVTAETSRDLSVLSAACAMMRAIVDSARFNPCTDGADGRWGDASFSSVSTPSCSVITTCQSHHT